MIEHLITYTISLVLTLGAGGFLCWVEKATEKSDLKDLGWWALF